MSELATIAAQKESGLFQISRKSENPIITLRTIGDLAIKRIVEGTFNPLDEICDRLDSDDFRENFDPHVLELHKGVLMEMSKSIRIFTTEGGLLFPSLEILPYNDKYSDIIDWQDDKQIGLLVKAIRNPKTHKYINILTGRDNWSQSLLGLPDIQRHMRIQLNSKGNSVYGIYPFGALATGALCNIYKYQMKERSKESQIEDHTIVVTENAAVRALLIDALTA